ncbi:MAG: phospholipid carrier-dependent glycosyltransferase [Euzebya sp.]
MTDIDIAPVAERPPPADPVPTGDRRAWRDSRGLLWAVALPLIVIIGAGAIRFYDLGTPSRCYFDETYYYYDARDYLDVGTETSFAVHPPVGKWLIAGGLALFGVDQDSPIQQAITTEDDNCLVEEDDGEGPNPEVRAREAAEAFARRAASALFGTASVAVAYFVGLRLFRRRSAALLGASLLAVDGLAITMSRISMLDIFLQFFVLLGVLAVLIDRDRLWEGTPSHPYVAHDDEPTPGPLPRPGRGWLWAAGLFLGLAVATKWSGLAPLGLAWVFVLGSEMWWRRRLTGRWTKNLFPAICRGFLALVFVPIIVYVASYGGWFANFESTRKAARCETTQAVDVEADTAQAPALPDQQVSDGCHGWNAVVQISEGWWEEQGEIFRFHKNLQADHPYRAPAWTWALMLRPVAYYYEACPSDGPAAADDPCEVPRGTVSEVLGIGNPAIWWVALIGYPFLLFYAVARRSWPAIFIALFLFGQSLPYLISPRPVFLFYLTPAVPFIALSLAYLADEALDSESMRWVPATISVVAMAGFVFWAPIFLGFDIPRQTWDLLILFNSWI